MSVFGAFDIVCQAAGDIAGEKGLCEAALPGQRPVGRLRADERRASPGIGQGVGKSSIVKAEDHRVFL